MKKLKILLLPAILVLYMDAELFAISAAVRSSKDYKFTTKILRELKPMMTNFKNDKNQEAYENLMKQFKEATLEFYGTNYDSSAIKYYNLKLELIKTLEEMNALYISRTEEILTATSEDNNAVDVFLTFAKNSGYAAYFNKPFDPLKDVKPYDEKFNARDFHLFYDLQKVESYLRNGHFNLNEAKRSTNDPEIAYIKSRKKIKTEQLDYIINKYLNSIQFCRIAKQSALEIYKIKNEFNTGFIQDKYGLRKDQITPIFDDRIPDKFKVDAVDNARMLYPVELERRKKTPELKK